MQSFWGNESPRSASMVVQFLIGAAKKGLPLCH
jgi:hypothetical protein